MKNQIKNNKIPGVFVIEKPTFSDARGFFREVLRFDELNKALGFDFIPVQINHSKSNLKVIRALHVENWNKLVYPITGKMFAALVDTRPDLPTFAKVEIIKFDEKNPKMLFVPKGVANSICVVGNKPVHYLYLVDAYYDGSDTRAIAWNDPDLAINWPIKDPLISERDKSNPFLRELYPHKFK